MKKEFDTIIIGTGTAGATVSFKLAKAGQKVAIIEKDEIGGTCVLQGCDPKKMLVSVIKTFDQVQKFKNKGISGEISINWNDLIKFKNTWTSPFPSNSEKRYKKAGIQLFKGEAKFLSQHEISIGNDSLVAKHIVIATGAKPMKINIPGEELTITNKEFLNLQQFPDDITFIGGGYIAMEFAHISARIGAKVTIIHMGKLPLENFDDFLVDNLVQFSKEIGINFILEHQVIEVEKLDSNNHLPQYLVKAKNLKTGKIINHKTSLVVKAAGRVANVDTLNLDRLNIKYSRKGIEINEYLQSKSLPNIYAAGDCAFSNGLPLTPIAETEGHIVAKNILNGNSLKATYKSIPTVVFTIPEIASAGLTKKQLDEKHIDYIEKKGINSRWFNAIRLNEKVYGYRIFIDKNTNQILGANLIGPDAAETINLFAFAINNNLTTKDIKTTIYAYPTFSSDVPYMV